MGKPKAGKVASVFRPVSRDLLHAAGEKEKKAGDTLYVNLVAPILPDRNTGAPCYSTAQVIPSKLRS